MNDNFFAMDIKATLEDGTEVSSVKGFVIDNKRVYKTNDGTVLTGTKKIKTMISQTILVSFDVFLYINSMENI
tara:strand:- start:65 stop:283 length:219 start_codon:yes stop_codon:yes gene_type:complete